MVWENAGDILKTAAIENASVSPVVDGATVATEDALVNNAAFAGGDVERDRRRYMIGSPSRRPLYNSRHLLADGDPRRTRRIIDGERSGTGIKGALAGAVST